MGVFDAWHDKFSRCAAFVAGIIADLLVCNTSDIPRFRLSSDAPKVEIGIFAGKTRKNPGFHDASLPNSNFNAPKHHIFSPHVPRMSSGSSATATKQTPACVPTLALPLSLRWCATPRKLYRRLREPSNAAKSSKLGTIGDFNILRRMNKEKLGVNG